MIYFDSLALDHENDQIKHQLHELFFKWNSTRRDGGVEFAEETEEKQNCIKDEALEREERLKRAQLKRDTAIHDFQARGGFTQVLQDIFNPTDLKSLELDSVF